MIAECMLLGTGAVVVKDAVTIEYLKSKQLELSDEEKQQFLVDKSRRFVHFTSKENAQNIIESGFVIPTKGILNNHFTKSIDNTGKKKNAEMVYLFDTAEFSVDDYIRNLPRDRSPFNGCFEYYAVSTKPDEHEINNFKRRAQDSAITYEGRLDIDGTDTRVSKYVLGLDEEGKYTLDEVPMDFEYTPSQELLDKLDHDRVGILKYNLKMYTSELKKAKTSLKKYKVQRKEDIEQIRKKREFAKANKQFIQEEKDKNYVFTKDGRTIVVKNVEYEEVGGRKLQKIAILENDEQNKKRKVGDAAKFCYMDEFNLGDIEPEIATEYFFNNLDRIKEKQSTVPEYIGLPLKNIETGEVTNEYDIVVDKTFKQYMDKRQAAKDIADTKYEELKQSTTLTSRIKSLFTKVFGRKNNVAMLEKGMSEEEQDRQNLAKLGYSSVEAMNADDNEIEMLDFLQSNVNDDRAVYSYNEQYNNEQREIEGQGKEEI